MGARRSECHNWRERGEMRRLEGQQVLSQVVCGLTKKLKNVSLPHAEGSPDWDGSQT
jgi:hypothetical protein